MYMLTIKFDPAMVNPRSNRVKKVSNFWPILTIMVNFFNIQVHLVEGRFMGHGPYLYHR